MFSKDIMASHVRPVTPALLQSLSSVLRDTTGVSSKSRSALHTGTPQAWAISDYGIELDNRGVVRYDERDTRYIVGSKDDLDTWALITHGTVITGVNAVIIITHGTVQRFIPYFDWRLAKMYDADDLGIDASLLPVTQPINSDTVRVHKNLRASSLGIARGTIAALKTIVETQNFNGTPIDTVIIAGAGAGGSSVAAYVGMDISSEIINVPIEVVAFGAPRFGNMAWNTLVTDNENFRLTRVVLPNDVVVDSPPTFAGFTHSGREQVVEGSQDVKYCAENTGIEENISADAVAIAASLVGILVLIGMAIAYMPGVVRGIQKATSYESHQRCTHALLLWTVLFIAVGLSVGFFVESRLFSAESYAENLQRKLQGTPTQADREGEECQRRWSGLKFVEYASVALAFYLFGLLSGEHLGYDAGMGKPLANTSFILASIVLIPAVITLI